MGIRRLAILVTSSSFIDLVGDTRPSVCVACRLPSSQSRPRAEMCRIAEFGAIDVSEDSWPALLATVGIDAIRDEARHFDDRMAMSGRAAQTASSTRATAVDGAGC